MRCIQKHPNDLLSVCAWVEELQCHPYIPVVIFKPQGEASSQTSSMVLTEDTFLLGIQTEYQCDAMRYHGAKVVCMDSTHGTN